MASKSENEAKRNYFSPEELMDVYPGAFVLGWTACKIGVCYSMGLLLGRHDTKERKNLIYEPSFRKLMLHANTVTRERLLDLGDE